MYNQLISDDRVNGERGIDERDDAALYTILLLATDEERHGRFS